jgi:drug/metabolite transporter (DMT)-like permease
MAIFQAARGGRADALAATLGVVAAAACWGISAIMAKVAFEHGVPPDRMAQARAAVALLVLAPLLAWRRRDLLRPPAGTLPLLLAFGLCVAAVNYAYYVAIDHLTVGVAISLQYTGPVLVLGWSVLVARAGATRVAWVAATCTLAGAVLVSQAFAGFGALDVTGLAAGAASAVLFSAYLLTAEAAGRAGVKPPTVLLWGFIAAVLAWSPIAPWWSWPFAALRQLSVLLAVIGVGLVGTLLPFFLAVAALRVVSAATAGIAATFEPVFAATFAWLLLGQRLRSVQLAGGLLVVAGVVLAQLAQPRTHPTAGPRQPAAAQARRLTARLGGKRSKGWDEGTGTTKVEEDTATTPSSGATR